MKLAVREGCRDLSKRGAVREFAVRNLPGGVVQYVEGFGTQVQLHPLRDERKLLMQAKVCVVVRIATQTVARYVAEGGGVAVARKGRVIVARVGATTG